MKKIMRSQLDMASVLAYQQFQTTIKVKKRSATRRLAGSVATLTSTLMVPSVNQSGPGSMPTGINNVCTCDKK